MTIIKTRRFNKRDNHIDVRFHFINEKVTTIEYFCSEEMIVDKVIRNTKISKYKELLVK